MSQSAKPPAAPMNLHEVAAVLKNVVARERSRPEFQRSLAELMPALKEKNPVRIVTSLENILARYDKDYPDLRPALESLRKSLETKGPGGMNYVEFIKGLLY